MQLLKNFQLTLFARPIRMVVWQEGNNDYQTAATAVKEAKTTFETNKNDLLTLSDKDNALQGNALIDEAEKKATQALNKNLSAIQKNADKVQDLMKGVKNGSASIENDTIAAGATLRGYLTLFNAELQKLKSQTDKQLVADVAQPLLDSLNALDTVEFSNNQSPLKLDGTKIVRSVEPAQLGNEFTILGQKYELQSGVTIENLFTNAQGFEVLVLKKNDSYVHLIPGSAKLSVLRDQGTNLSEFLKSEPPTDKMTILDLNKGGTKTLVDKKFTVETDARGNFVLRGKEGHTFGDPAMAEAVKQHVDLLATTDVGADQSRDTVRVSGRELKVQPGIFLNKEAGIKWMVNEGKTLQNVEFSLGKDGQSARFTLDLTQPNSQPKPVDDKIDPTLFLKQDDTPAQLKTSTAPLIEADKLATDTSRPDRLRFIEAKKESLSKMLEEVVRNLEDPQYKMSLSEWNAKILNAFGLDLNAAKDKDGRYKAIKALQRTIGTKPDGLFGMHSAYRLAQHLEVNAIAQKLKDRMEGRKVQKNTSYYQRWESIATKDKDVAQEYKPEIVDQNAEQQVQEITTALKNKSKDIVPKILKGQDGMVSVVFSDNTDPQATDKSYFRMYKKENKVILEQIVSSDNFRGTKLQTADTVDAILDRAKNPDFKRTLEEFQKNLPREINLVPNSGLDKPFDDEPLSRFYAIDVKVNNQRYRIYLGQKFNQDKECFVRQLDKDGNILSNDPTESVMAPYGGQQIIDAIRKISKQRHLPDYKVSTEPAKPETVQATLSSDKKSIELSKGQDKINLDTSALGNATLETVELEANKSTYKLTVKVNDKQVTIDDIKFDFDQLNAKAKPLVVELKEKIEVGDQNPKKQMSLLLVKNNKGDYELKLAESLAVQGFSSLLTLGKIDNKEVTITKVDMLNKSVETISVRVQLKIDTNTPQDVLIRKTGTGFTFEPAEITYNSSKYTINVGSDNKVMFVKNESPPPRKTVRQNFQIQLRSRLTGLGRKIVNFDNSSQASTLEQTRRLRAAPISMHATFV